MIYAIMVMVAFGAPRPVRCLKVNHHYTLWKNTPLAQEGVRRLNGETIMII